MHTELERWTTEAVQMDRQRPLALLAPATYGDAYDLLTHGSSRPACATHHRI